MFFVKLVLLFYFDLFFIYLCLAVFASVSCRLICFAVLCCLLFGFAELLFCLALNWFCFTLCFVVCFALHLLFCFVFYFALLCCAVWFFVKFCCLFCCVVFCFVFRFLMHIYIFRMAFQISAVRSSANINCDIYYFSFLREAMQCLIFTTIVLLQILSG